MRRDEKECQQPGPGGGNMGCCGWLTDRPTVSSYVQDKPVVVTKFILNAKEIEFDAVGEMCLSV